ncbi:RES family NAD+ phosphorylase [Clostridium sp.]|uniref:RES family NAD+ phosphorylase n=1 Tax=Clostridium sp. TaxID=1506 RepID=UPI001D55BF59|nr:RES family NAD+ phosphorylase [Clostridium sp.]MBS5985251.1 RES family NAD+ phosphorylase [Clostridium sp.]
MPKYEGFFELSESQLIDAFCEIFYHELESWFSADIACCEDCYNNFINKWPATYSRNEDFQKVCIDIKSFYEGSMLKDFFYEEEYLRLIKNIECPRCKNPIWNSFWPYNFSFDLPDGFEMELEEIDKLASETPFLLLSHPLARDVYSEIKKISEKVESVHIKEKYYRGRVLEREKEYHENDLKCAPKHLVKEGRYNHAGNPVIYLADSPLTSFYEMRKPSQGIALAEVNITSPLKVLDLIELEDDWGSVLNIISWSSLLSSPKEGEGWYKPQYTFTRFVADCAKQLGFDAIKYPSIRHGKHHNIVILNGMNNSNKIKIASITEFNNNDNKIDL